jgi:hypothetical protein
MTALSDAITLIKELEAHLDYCGWGDRWERECSKELRKSLPTRLAAIESAMETKE